MRCGASSNACARMCACVSDCRECNAPISRRIQFKCISRLAKRQHLSSTDCRHYSTTFTRSLTLSPEMHALRTAIHMHSAHTQFHLIHSPIPLGLSFPAAHFLQRLQLFTFFGAFGQSSAYAPMCLCVCVCMCVRASCVVCKHVYG